MYTAFDFYKIGFRRDRILKHTEINILAQMRFCNRKSLNKDS